MVTIALASKLWDEILDAATQRDEVAGVLLCRLGGTSTRKVLLARSIHWVDDRFARRSPHGLSISSAGYVPALGTAREDGSIPVFFHSHPDGEPFPSERDKRVNEQVAELFIERSRSRYFGSFVVATGSAVSFTGTLSHDSGVGERIDKLRIAGSAISMILAADSYRESLPPHVDRQVKAFGADGQRVLGAVSAAVVGLGGTGSAVATLLARLGVGQLTLIDDDNVDATNLPRLHGATRRDVGKPKAVVARRHIRSLGFNNQVRAITRRVTSHDAARRLVDSDVVFGCTDDHAGRAVLSRFAYAYLAPLIDLGFQVAADAGLVTGLYGRISLAAPGVACLLCRGRIDLDRAKADALPPSERRRLAQEGYVVGLAEAAPSVVSFTTTIASLAVDDFLDRLFVYGDARGHSETLLLLDQWRLITSVALGREGHYCRDTNFMARGDQKPFLGQIWRDAPSTAIG